MGAGRSGRRQLIWVGLQRARCELSLFEQTRDVFRICWCPESSLYHSTLPLTSVPIGLTDPRKLCRRFRLTPPWCLQERDEHFDPETRERQVDVRTSHRSLSRRRPGSVETPSRQYPCQQVSKDIPWRDRAAAVRLWGKDRSAARSSRIDGGRKRECSSERHVIPKHHIRVRPPPPPRSSNRSGPGVSFPRLFEVRVAAGVTQD